MRIYESTHSGNMGQTKTETTDMVVDTLKSHGSMTRLQILRQIPEANSTMIDKIVGKLRKEGKVTTTRDGRIVIYHWVWSA